MILKLPVRKGKSFNYLLIFYPNPRPPQPPIKGHVFSKLKSRHILPNHLFPVLFWPTSTSSQTRHGQPLTLLTRASMLLLFTCPNHLSLVSCPLRRPLPICLEWLHSYYYLSWYTRSSISTSPLLFPKIEKIIVFIIQIKKIRLVHQRTQPIPS